MGSIVSCYSYALSTIESLSQWITFTAVVCCLVTTITLVLGLGIGLGYNYCFVEMVTKYKIAPARYLHPDDSADWSYQAEQNAANPENTFKNVPHMLRITEDAEMFKEVIESERQYDQNKQKYIFHSIPPVTISPEGTMLPNIEETPNLTTLAINITDSYGNSTESTTNMFSVSITNGSEVKDIDLKKPTPISPAGLLTLLAKLRAENKNYTLQIITT
ncbi:unnamed protein product [Arctia plantaginis]|uniref:Uncharacterized protein n=1 Tax=Arctia plantaginis TaxID=874455 RepID=A0A8S1BT24_ARCPL|nr:unnamed protein product [Arctia plantaginis]